jgi:uncharacterized repeat protein (TIGR04138 family)
MKELGDFFTKLSGILKRDPRYRDEAYLFVMASLGKAMEHLEKPRHVTGAELLAAIRREAEHQFGPMATAVFEHWGVKNSLDFGRIVFNMVEEGLLSKTETDSLEDFKDAVFFEHLFNSETAYRLEEDNVKILKKS